MKKIPTIFKRNPEKMSELLDEPHPDCDWVFAGEGKATRKYDGTCCMVRDGKLYKRREVKKGKPEPEGFELAEHDQNTGKKVGWMVATDEDKWHAEAWASCDAKKEGTYELLGPKIQGNPEDAPLHTLFAHADADVYERVPIDIDGIRIWMESKNIEGLVWHHPDGRMAKIKKKDLGLKR